MRVVATGVEEVGVAVLVDAVVFVVVALCRCPAAAGVQMLEASLLELPSRRWMRARVCWARRSQA